MCPCVWDNRRTYISSNISPTKSDVNIRLGKVWTAMDRLSTKWKFGLSYKIKQEFFQDVSVSVILYSCTIWTQISVWRYRLDGNYVRVLHPVLNESSTHHPTKQQQPYSHLPSISQAIQDEQEILHVVVEAERKHRLYCVSIVVNSLSALCRKPNILV